MDLLGLYTSFLIALTVGFASSNTFKHLQKSHEINLLNIDQVRTLASASDKDYFKKSLLDPFLIVRPAGSDGNIKVQQHIKNYMSKYGWFIETDSFTDDTPYGKKPFTNIIATFNKYAPRKLTLACHFDSKYFTEFEFIGATDSAVPCAMMLDLARVLETYLKKGPGSGAWDVTLQFIFFDGEEAFKKWTSKDSIYGARHLAEKMAGNYKQVGRDEVVREIETMDALILLDLIGAKDPIFRNWFSKTEHLFKSMADIENRMAKNGMLEPVAAFQTRKYNKYFQYSKALGGGIQDDHIPFLERDVPVLHLIAYPFPDVWHRHDDDESALDYTTIDNLNRILRVFVAEYLHLYI